MTAKIIEIVVMEGIALIMFGLAWAIGVKKKMELIAGYNERTARQVIDKDGLARLIARLCVLLGIGSALMPLATTIWADDRFGFGVCLGAYAGFMIGLVALTSLQARDYTRR